MYNMKYLPTEICIGNLKKIYTVDFDISIWTILYGTSAVKLFFVPPNKTNDEGYFVSTTIHNSILTWNIIQEDIAILGRGHIVIILEGNNKIKKSENITVIIQ